MNVIGLVAVVFFAIGWAGGVAAWFYAAYHFVVGKFKADEPEHMRKFWKGGAAFIGCWLFAVSNGLIGAWFGGWRPSQKNAPATLRLEPTWIAGAGSAAGDWGPKRQHSKRSAFVKKASAEAAVSRGGSQAPALWYAARFGGSPRPSIPTAR